MELLCFVMRLVSDKCSHLSRAHAIPNSGDSGSGEALLSQSWRESALRHSLLILPKVSGDIRPLWQRKNSLTASMFQPATPRVETLPPAFAGNTLPGRYAIAGCHAVREMKLRIGGDGLMLVRQRPARQTDALDFVARNGDRQIKK
jgi:hypothetical protein